MKTVLIVEIDHKTPMPDSATDIIADRVYSFLYARRCECEVTVKAAVIEDVTVRTVREIEGVPV